MASIASTISKIAIGADHPARMTICDFNGRPVRADDGSTTYIDLLSIDSKAATTYQRERVQRRLDAQPGAGVDTDQVHSDTIGLLVALTVGWGNVSKDQAKVTPDKSFSVDAARALYSDPDNVELLDQVTKFIYGRANFAKASPKS